MSNMILSTDLKIYLDGKRLGYITEMSLVATSADGLILVKLTQAKPRKGANAFSIGTTVPVELNAALVCWKGKVVRLMTTNATSAAELLEAGQPA
jgi:hypothetical protein